MAYKTSYKYNPRKSYKSRFEKRLKKLKAHKGRKSWSRSILKKGGLKGKVKKIIGIFAGIFFIFIFIGTIFALSIVAKYSSELPNPDEPFERGQDLTSYVFDRNGKELYKIHGDENRDIAQIEEVPLDVQWAFIATEDLDFYTHKGVDLGGVIKAGLYECCKIGQPRGGSTITQQMIKNTVLTPDRSYERKVKEIILSLRIEQKYAKTDILQLYMNEIGFGGNTYGIKTAARVYFGKDVKDLTLAEGALLAALPNEPGILSPLFASDLTRAQELSVQRQQWVLDEMLKKKDTINSYARKYNGLGKDEEVVTAEKIQQAKEQLLVYKSAEVYIEAPHFVFYAENELQVGTYNNGKPFTQSEIERGGLRITTSIDLDMQHIAEQSVKDGVVKYGIPNGGNNAALVTIDPKTGQILAMVGSANYFAAPTPEGCTLGVNCKFEPKVNVSISLRQPGSSLKPMVALAGFESGQLYPASFLPDIPVEFGNYKPKNNEGGFMGPMTLRTAMELSRNIPFVEALEIVGVTGFLNTLEKIGYTTFTSPENYGDALALGAGDVKLVEHTNAFATIADAGNYHRLSPILKVEDKDGNVIYDYAKDSSREGVRVIDERSAYLIDDVNKNYHVTPPAGFDFAGKTGTNDDNKNVWYMGYSPVFSTGVWVGNNDNSRMYNSAYGYSVARPIWIDYTNKIIGKYQPTRFIRPGGIVSASVCSDSGMASVDNCTSISDLFIEGKLPAPDTYHKTYRVCSDEPDKLARAIDEQLGYAVDKVYSYVEAPKKEWQPFWDAGLKQGAPPTESCTINRNPSGNENPWVVISSPITGTSVHGGDSLNIAAAAYSASVSIEKIEIYFGSTYMGQAANNPVDQSITVPSGLSTGNYELKLIAYDSVGRTGTASVNIFVGDSVAITNPVNGQTLTANVTISVQALHTGGGSVSYARLRITNPDSSIDTGDMLSSGGSTYAANWTPESAGSYSLQVVMHLGDGTEIHSTTINVTAKSAT